MSKIFVGIVGVVAVMATGTIVHTVHCGKDRRTIHGHRDRTDEVGRRRTAGAANVPGRPVAFVITDRTRLMRAGEP